MNKRIFLVDWDKDSAKQLSKTLGTKGWSVEVETEDGGRAYGLIQKSNPQAVLVNLARKPSHGIELGSSLRDVKKTKDLPILFLDADDDVKTRAKKRVSNARFTTISRLEDDLSILKPKE